MNLSGYTIFQIYKILKTFLLIGIWITFGFKNSNGVFDWNLVIQTPTKRNDVYEIYFVKIKNKFLLHEKRYNW